MAAASSTAWSRVAPRPKTLLAVAVLVLAIHLSYQYIVAPLYTYMGLTYATPNIFIYGVMLGLIVGLALLMPLKLARPADFLLWALYIIVVIPSLTISYLARTVDNVMQLTMGFVIAGCFAGVIMLARTPFPRLGVGIPRLAVKTFWILILTFTAATYLSLAMSGTLRLSLPGLNQVYEVRSTFVGANAAHRLTGYLVPNQANVINPLLIAIGVQTRRYWIMAAGIVGELLLYAAAAYKTVLFAAPALLIVAFFFRGGRRPQGALVAWAFAGVIAGSAIVDQAFSTPWLTSLLTRRFLDLPGLLTGAWVNVFSAGPKAYFAYSFLSPFLTYPYPVKPAFLVAGTYFGQPKMDANANLFADGYANLGWAGMVFEAAVLALILILANSLSRGLPLRVAVMMVFMPAISLANTSVLTSLLTHGVLLALLVLAFAPRSMWVPVPRAAAVTVRHRVVDQSPPPTPATVGGSPPQPRPLRGAVPGRPAPSWWQRAKAQSMPPGATPVVAGPLRTEPDPGRGIGG